MIESLGLINWICPYEKTYCFPFDIIVCLQDSNPDQLLIIAAQTYESFRQINRRGVWTRNLYPSRGRK